MWAWGTGNLAIPAAKAGARVSGIDIAPNLIAEAQLEARAAGVSIAFEVGDAESLPYLPASSTPRSPCSARCSPSVRSGRRQS
jgi:ubiquinone/menaquinone biosynthesis C-methylase UbiE